MAQGNLNLPVYGRYESTSAEKTTSINSHSYTSVDTIRIPTKGLWLVMATAIFDSNQSGSRAVSMGMESVSVSWQTSAYATSYGSTALQIVRLVTASSPVDINLYARQTSGSALDVTTRMFAIPQ